MNNNKDNLVTMFKKLPVERKAMIAETAVIAISWIAKKAIQSYQNRKNKKELQKLEEKKESI
jgi:hypothetical protein